MRYTVGSKAKRKRPRKKPERPKLPTRAGLKRILRTGHWENYGGLWPKGILLKVGEVICTVDRNSNRGGEYYNATLTWVEKDRGYVGGKKNCDRHGRFVDEEAAQRWCVKEALELQGFLFDEVLMLKEATGREFRRPKGDGRVYRGNKVPVAIDVGGIKIRTEMNERTALQLVQTLKIRTDIPTP